MSVDSGLRRLDPFTQPSISQITSNMFISNWAAACNEKILADRDIGTIVCINLENQKSQTDLDMYKRHRICHIYISLDDAPDVNIIQVLSAASQFITRGLCSGRPVLVHCTMGISRSCSVVIGYLMLSRRMPLDNIVQYVTGRRPICRPNPGFMRQLLRLERDLIIHDITKRRRQSAADLWPDKSTQALAPQIAVE